MLNAALSLALGHHAEGTSHERRIRQRSSDETLLNVRGLGDTIDMIESEDGTRPAVRDELDSTPRPACRREVSGRAVWRLEHAHETAQDLRSTPVVLVATDLDVDAIVHVLSAKEHAHPATDVARAT